MKRVGIVTWYWGNYGSILQAYALQNVVQEYGFDCEIIRHCVTGGLKTQVTYRVKRWGITKTASYYWQKAVTKMLEKAMQKDSDRGKVLDEFVEEHLCLSEREFHNHNFSECSDYDVYICGSDQIWNPGHTFLSKFYWLDFAPIEATRIAYAPSMGRVQLDDEEKKVVRGYLKPYTAIAVREQVTADGLNAIIPERDIKVVVDPTLLIPADKWKEKLPKRKIEEEYLFAYILRGDKEQREYISKVAKEKNLKLVVYQNLEELSLMSNEKTWGDVRCNQDTPFDFLEKIFNAKMVITDSFHCTVFSLLFEKDFFLMKKKNDRTNQFARLEQLLLTCGVSNRVIFANRDLSESAIDYATVRDKIAKKRVEGRDFLLHALNRK